MDKTKKQRDSIYFTDETENAIIEYKKTKDEKLYNEKIHPALERMVEAIIKTFNKYYGFYRYLSYDDLYAEGISFIYPKLFEFNPDKGKAFSFLGTCLKRYFIEITIKNSRKNIYHIDSVGCRRTELEEMESIVPPVDNDEIERIDNTGENKFFDNFLIYIKSIRDDICENIGEVIVFESICKLLKEWHITEMYNKKAFNLVLRDMTTESLKTTNIVFNKIKEKYFEFSENYNRLER